MTGYKLVHSSDLAEFERELNAAAAEGWTLAEVTTPTGRGPVAILSRERPEVAPQR
jgi:hypothetical protein